MENPSPPPYKNDVITTPYFCFGSSSVYVGELQDEDGIDTDTTRLPVTFFIS